MNPSPRSTAPDAPPSTAVDVLTLNSGSSTLKWGLHRVVESGCTTRMGETLEAAHADAPCAVISDRLRASGLPWPKVIGHRIVHGGPRLARHTLIDETVLEELKAACRFAPLHGPAALELLREAQACFPGAAQVACLDTAFHDGLPDEARTLPLPRAWRDAGVRRYGFHGLSCESIVEQLGADLPERLVIAHLGGGASVTAVLRGRSIDTSMSLTPSGGLLMGSRSGDLDPGVLLHLMRDGGLDATALDALINRQSGLLGISGLSSDLRQLHAAADTHPDAALAIRMFCRSACRHILGMGVALDGIEGLVFTGGIGENDAAARARICEALDWIGLRLDPRLNRSGYGTISAPDSRIRVQVVASREDTQIARHAAALLAAPGRVRAGETSD